MSNQHLLRELNSRRMWSETADPSTEYALKMAIENNFEKCRYDLCDSTREHGAQPALGFAADDKPAILKKYRYLWAISRSIRVSSLVELGVFRGASADAFLDANPNMHYLGVDDFLPHVEDCGPNFAEATRLSPEEQSKKVLEFLTRFRGHTEVELRIANLRQLDELPQSDAVHVDAAHDFHNERHDLELAITAGPQYILVDDYDGTVGEKHATNHFLSKHSDVVAAIVPIEYHGGGALVALNQLDREAVLQQRAAEREIERLTVGKWIYHRVGYDSRPVELLSDGMIGDGSAFYEWCWRIDAWGEGHLLTIASRYGETCRLRQVGEDRFEGRWLTFERMPVELVRVQPGKTAI